MSRSYIQRWQLAVKPAQKTPAIVSLEARVYLIVSVSKDTEAVQRVVTPVQVRKNHLIFGPVHTLCFGCF